MSAIVISSLLYFVEIFSELRVSCVVCRREGSRLERGRGEWWRGERTYIHHPMPHGPIDRASTPIKPCPSGP